MIFSNIHLCFIYFKQLLSTVKVHYVIKDVSYDGKPKTFIYLFWSEIAFKKSMLIVTLNYQLLTHSLKNLNHEKLEVRVIIISKNMW